MTMLQFPARTAVGEVWWEDAREPNGSGHRLAISVVEVPDGTAVSLHVYTVVEVSVSDQAVGIFSGTPDGSGTVPAALPRRKSRDKVTRRVTWKRGGRGGARRNTRSIWGEGSYSVSRGKEPVDLEFIRRLPPNSVSELSVGRVVPGSFAAVAHLAPGLRSLGVYLDNLGGDAPSVIAELKALESLRLYGDSAMDEGRRLDDHALSMVAGPPGPGIPGTSQRGIHEQGLGQLVRLPKLRHLHIEREGLTVPMFRFAAAMPALTNLAGLDEFGDDGPMPPAEVQRVRALLPHISLDSPA